MSSLKVKILIALRSFIKKYSLENHSLENHSLSSEGLRN